MRYNRRKEPSSITIKNEYQHSRTTQPRPPHTHLHPSTFPPGPSSSLPPILHQKSPSHSHSQSIYTLSTPSINLSFLSRHKSPPVFLFAFLLFSHTHSSRPPSEPHPSLSIHLQPLLSFPPTSQPPSPSVASLWSTSHHNYLKGKFPATYRKLGNNAVPQTPNKHIINLN